MYRQRVYAYREHKKSYSINHSFNIKRCIKSLRIIIVFAISFESNRKYVQNDLYALHPTRLQSIYAKTTLCLWLYNFLSFALPFSVNISIWPYMCTRIKLYRSMMEHLLSYLHRALLVQQWNRSWNFAECIFVLVLSFFCFLHRIQWW